MREHPIPQDITNYKFHIVGNMTLKQFVEIAAGVVLAVMLNVTNLPNPIKYVLMFVAFISGAAIAFVPIEERPLDHWITTFLKIMYKPTKFFWKRTPKIPDAFTFKLNDESTSLINEVDLSPARKKRIHDYLESLTIDEDPYAWNDHEQDRMDSILQTFHTVDVVEIDIKQTNQKPNLGVRVRDLSTPYQQAPISDSNQQPEVHELAIPGQEAVKIEHNMDNINGGDIAEGVITSEDNYMANDSSFLTSDQQQVNQPFDYEATAISHNADLPFPTRPTEPNKIVGMVLTPDNKLVTNAIVDIKDMNGSIVRAIKTNMLGQFFVTTPLSNGDYLIDVDAQNNTFNTHQLALRGKVVDPVEIRSNE